MPQKPRRRLTRRSAPPRPTYPGAPAPPEAEVPSGAPSLSRPTATRRTAEVSRPAEYVARQTPLLRSEMKRVAGVAIVCFGLLVVLAIVDRLQVTLPLP